MRDNWMTHQEFSPGDEFVEISHSMLIDRLRYLPGNQIEGNQTLMVRSILNEEASTNLVVQLSVVGTESIETVSEEGSLMPMLILLMSVVIVILMIIVGVVVSKMRREDYNAHLEHEWPDN